MIGGCWLTGGSPTRASCSDTALSWMTNKGLGARNDPKWSPLRQTWNVAHTSWQPSEASKKIQKNPALFSLHCTTRFAEDLIFLTAKVYPTLLWCTYYSRKNSKNVTAISISETQFQIIFFKKDFFMEKHKLVKTYLVYQFVSLLV